MLSKRRTGGHRHITPLNGRARQVQAYPPDLCKALCTGIKNQIKEEQSVTTNSLVNGKHWDDVSGGWLGPRLVAEARAEEMEYIHMRKVYTRLPSSQCFRETVKAPIKTGWVETKERRASRTCGPGG